MATTSPSKNTSLDLLTRLSDSLAALTRGRLWLQVIFVLFLGIGVGLLLSPLKSS